MIAVFGVKGSPGATTTALLAAALWPAEAVVVEADPGGADLPLRLAGPAGQALPGSPGIAELAVDVAAGSDAAAGVWAHALQTAAGVPVVLGLPSPEPMEETIRQHGGLLAAALRAEEAVIVDAGRLSPSSPALAFAAAADVVALVVPDTAEGFFRARDLLGGLVSRWSGREAMVRAAVVPVVVADGRRAVAATRQLGEVLANRGIAASDPVCVSWDPRSVGRLLGGGARGLEKSELVRSARPVAETLHGMQQQIRAARASSAPPSSVPQARNAAVPPRSAAPPPTRQQQKRVAWPPLAGEI